MIEMLRINSYDSKITYLIKCIWLIPFVFVACLFMATKEFFCLVFDNIKSIKESFVYNDIGIGRGWFVKITLEEEKEYCKKAKKERVARLFNNLHTTEQVKKGDNDYRR